MTNVRFSHDDRKLVSVGGADMSVMVWVHRAGSREPAPATDESESGVQMTSSGYMSEESDTDSEEEGDYVLLRQLITYSPYDIVLNDIIITSFHLFQVAMTVM